MHNTTSSRKTSRRTMSGCNPVRLLVLLLTLTSVTAIQKLRTISDLKKIPFGDSVPTHSLVLLHWFAQNIEVDNNDVIQLTFEPERGDYGAHHYGNYEGLLDPLSRGHRYYTLGNLNPNINVQRSVVLPDYLSGNLNNLIRHEERNRDRIIFRVRTGNHITVAGAAWQTIDRVYITQHYMSVEGQGTPYDPNHTYHITINLLREIRLFTLENNGWGSLVEIRDYFGSHIQDNSLSSLRNTWGNLACLGLLWFIVVKEKNLPRKTTTESAADQPRRGPRTVKAPKRDHVVVNMPQNNRVRVHTPERVADRSFARRNPNGGMTLEVRTGNKGKARIHWSGVPHHLLESGVRVVLFKNDSDLQGTGTYKTIRDTWGHYDTSVALNDDLQVRLHKNRRRCWFWTAMGDEIKRGQGFHSPQTETPVSITGFDAKLQLTVIDGKACARLYVGKNFHWQTPFRKSWIGFYTSGWKLTTQYETWQWQWATKFQQCDDLYDDLYDVYEYRSSLPVAPGVQARFIISGSTEKARTATWE